MNISWENILDLALLWLWSQVVIFALAGLGAPLLAGLGQLLPSRSKAFLYKLHRQLAGLSNILLLFILLSSMGITAYYLRTDPSVLPVEARPYMILGFGSFGLATLLSLLYRILWGPLKNMKNLLACFGLLAGFSGLASIFVISGLKRAFLISPEAFSPVLQEGLRRIYLLPASSQFWPFLVQLCLLCLTAAGGVGLVHLLLRRKKDDYGRDYYNYTLKHCARFAWAAALLQIPFLGWLLWKMAPEFGAWNKANPAVWAFAAAILSLLLAAFLWNAVSRSTAPLRDKPLILLAMFLPGTSLWAMALPFILQLLAV